MISTEPARQAGNDDLGLYTLAVVAALVGVIFTFAAAVLNGGRLFLAVPVLTVLLSVSGAYLSESYVSVCYSGFCRFTASRSARSSRRRTTRCWSAS